MVITREDLDRGLALELEYAGGPTIRVRGPVTGTTYVFSGLQRVQAVDPRDAAAIARDRHFRVRGMIRREAERDGQTGSQAG